MLTWISIISRMNSSSNPAAYRGIMTCETTISCHLHTPLLKVTLWFKCFSCVNVGLIVFLCIKVFTEIKAQKNNIHPGKMPP